MKTTFCVIAALMVLWAAPARADQTLCVSYPSLNMVHQVIINITPPPPPAQEDYTYAGDIRDTTFADIPKWHSPWNHCDLTVNAEAVHAFYSGPPMPNQLRWGITMVCVTYPSVDLIHEFQVRYAAGQPDYIDNGRFRTTSSKGFMLHDLPWRECDVTLKGELP